MNEEIRKLFPTEFGVNSNMEMIAEISLKNLNKIVDYITNLQQKYEEADNDIHKLFEQKEKAINILELSSQNKGICTRPETDTIQSVISILKGDDKSEY